MNVPEYRTKTVGQAEAEKELNEAAQHGWVLIAVSALHGTNKVMLFMERAAGDIDRVGDLTGETSGTTLRSLNEVIHDVLHEWGWESERALSRMLARGTRVTFTIEEHVAGDIRVQQSSLTWPEARPKPDDTEDVVAVLLAVADMLGDFQP